MASAQAAFIPFVVTGSARLRGKATLVVYSQRNLGWRRKREHSRNKPRFIFLCVPPPPLLFVDLVQRCTPVVWDEWNVERFRRCQLPIGAHDTWLTTATCLQWHPPPWVDSFRCCCCTLRGVSTLAALAVDVSCVHRGHGHLFERVVLAGCFCLPSR